uniref:Uncharacterized protein n=1 Tax=Rangifer tarandus platyrhynchus TaxID=3082113 RepID=A0ACB0EFV8_RANTA|nr:unnamed protein product [Rangifer tarandus platyrhynchus]
MLRVPALLLVFLAPVTQVSSNMEEDRLSVMSATGSSVVIDCDLTHNYLHWYKFQEGAVPRRLLYYDVSYSKVVLDSGISQGKYHVYKGTGKGYTILISSLQESDSGTYYCAFWEKHIEWKKIFGKGTRLIITPHDRNLATDISPKPTIFLPSIAEINHSKTGTYLSLLEKFFPDIIEVYWKEKDGNRALPSQKGNTMKTTDTYMKFSWLTVAENSMDKEHICVVKHERNIGGINQEILFPSINEEVTGTGSKKDCLKDESDTLQLQLMNTSAYYTYLLLLLKSAVYFIITTSCVFRRTGVCCDGKNL